MAVSIVHQFDLAVIGPTTPIVPNSPLTPARGQSGGDDYPGSIGVRSKWVNKNHPYVGEQIEGWKWNHRLWTADDDENCHENIPWCFNPSVSGITSTYFQKGIGANRDLELLSVEKTLCSGLVEQDIFRPFTPIVYHGKYFLDSTGQYLHSDDAVLTSASWSGLVQGVEGGPPNPGLWQYEFSLVQLEFAPKGNIPITARSYFWDASTAAYSVYREWEKKHFFSPTPVSSPVAESLLTTFDHATGRVWYERLDQNRYEFVVSTSGIRNGERATPELVFNQQVVTPPTGGTQSGLFLAQLEVVGISDGTNDQEFHTYLSPIDSGMPGFCYSALSMPDIFFGGFDPALGLVGGGPIPSGVGFPASGVTEWMVHQEGSVTPSGYMTLWDLDLGLVRFGDVVPPAGEYVAVAYYGTARVEYEPENTENFVRAHEANMNPLHRHVGEGFLTFSRSYYPPVSIELVALADEISADSYGPVDMGSAYTTLQATVYDSSRVPLEGEVVTFEITSAPAVGAFGSSSTVTSVTNQDGKAFAYYNPPKSIDDIGEEIVFADCTEDFAPPYPGVASTLTMRTSNMSFVGDLDEVRVYETHIDDWSVGAFDTAIDPLDFAAQKQAFYEDYLTANNIGGPTGMPISDYVAGKSWEELHRELMGFLEPVLHLEDNTKVGSRVLAATWSSEALNPHSFVEGAWVPKKPYAIDKISDGVYDVVFDTTVDAMPLPTASDPAPSGTLYSYYIVAPTAVTLIASVVNEATNQTIFSNDININLNIPDNMNGVWILDEINEIHIDEISSQFFSIVAAGQEVPFGWRLPSSNLSLAAMLGGVIFMDKNPNYNANIWNPTEVPPLRHQFEVV